MIFFVRLVDILCLKHSDEACCSVPSGRHTQTHRCASSLVDCRWPQLIELAEGGQLCSWGRLSGQLSGEMVAWLQGTAEQSYHDPGRHTPKSAHCAALVSPGRVGQDKRARNFPRPSFQGVWTTPRPWRCPQGPLSWPGEWERPRNKGRAVNTEQLRREVCVSASVYVLWAMGQGGIYDIIVTGNF